MTTTYGAEAGRAAEAAYTSSCPSCDERLLGEYCHRCGERRADGRDLSLRRFVGEALQELTSIEHSKIFRTVKALLVRPGFLTREWLAGRRGRYLKPLNLCLGVFALSLFFYSIYKPVSMYDLERFVVLDETRHLSTMVDKWAARKNMPRGVLIDQISEKWHGYMSLFQIFNVVLFALVLQALYLFSRRYFVEHLIFAMHFVTFSILAVVLLFPVYLAVGLVPTPATKALAAFKWLVDLVYMFVAVRSVYGHTTVKSLLLSVVLLAGYFVTYLFCYVGALLAAVISVAKM